MRYPLNMGMTGIAIDQKGPFISLDGEDDPKYSFEVDNINQLLDFENILIMPLIDSNGQLKGVIQLVNKIDSSEIPEEDAIELSQICPSIAEILNFCDLATDVSNVSQGLTLSMD